MSDREYVVEIEERDQSGWYVLDNPYDDVLEACASFERYVAFGRTARITGRIVRDVEYR